MIRRRGVWLAVAAAVIGLIAIAFVSASFWRSLGGAEISGAGWLAMGLGVLFSLVVGIGLMALVFYSNRHGYDD